MKIRRRLMLGDCLQRMTEIEDGSVDMVMTDPPYGTTACKWDSVIDLDRMWEHLKRLIKPNGAIVLMASQPFTSVLVCSNLKMFKYCWVWEKSKAANYVHANFQPLKAHEDVCVWSYGGSAQGSKNPMIYNPQHTQGKPYHKGFGSSPIRHLSAGQTKHMTRELSNKSGQRKPRSVVYFPLSVNRGKHPTQKPVALMEYLIRTYTNEGDTVLDFAMGSGTTGVACKHLRRSFIGIEMDKGYYRVARKRIRNAECDMG